MSTELTELETVKAQLKEQTQQMAEMASMMKSLMSQAMPLLEEQAGKLRKEKAAEAARKKKEDREREREERKREEWNRTMAAAQMADEQEELALFAAEIEADKAADEKEQKEKELAAWFEKEKKERDTKPLGAALGDFYQEKSQIWWRCPADDKLHVFRWEKGGSELLVNWKGEAWGCRRAGAGFGEIMYECANEGNWIGVYVRGEDRWDSSGPLRSANIPPPPPGPSYPNGFPGGPVPPQIFVPLNCPPGVYSILYPRLRGGRY
jgi:hypothetical protein